MNSSESQGPDPRDSVPFGERQRWSVKYSLILLAVGIYLGLGALFGGTSDSAFEFWVRIVAGFGAAAFAASDLTAHIRNREVA